MSYFTHFNLLSVNIQTNTQSNQVFYESSYGPYLYFPSFICNNEYLLNYNYPHLLPITTKIEIVDQNQFYTEKNKNEDQKDVQNYFIQQRQENIIYLQNRNVLPNNVSFIVSHIRRINKSGKLVQKIINKLSKGNKDYLVKRFFAYQTYLKENCTDYVNNNAISILSDHINENCQIFTLDEQIFYNKITRILISTYLRQNCILQVLGMGKVKKSSIPDHLKVHRYLQQVLKSPKNCQYVLKYH